MTRLHEAHHAATTHLPAPPAAVLLGDTVVRTADLVRLLTVDQVLCAEDLRHELPTLKVPRAALAQAVRMLAEVMRTRHPGGSIEIRVPPFAAIQCGDPGEPRHTRGTPPNVVECQPLTFIRLCRGHDTFAAARHRNELTASGTRADISAWLPL